MDLKFDSFEQLKLNHTFFSYRKMEIQCTFENSDKHYGCFIENHQIPEDKELLLIGQHGAEETNNDVTLLQFNNCSMPLFSKELFKYFPNLKVLEIKNSSVNQFFFH